MNSLITLYVTDEIEPLLERMSANNKRMLTSVAKSWGWFQQREIKKGVKSGSPGGATFEQRTPIEMRRALQGGSAAKQWYGKMLRAIGYQYKDGKVEIGWTSRTSAMYGRKQEFGYQTPVTEEIRRKFARAGYPLRGDTKYLELPERNVFDPMAGELQPQLSPFVQNRINDYQTGNVEFSKKARRKYKVYG